MPQGANAWPSWFVKVFNKVVYDLDRVLEFLDDVFCFDEDPISHVANVVAVFQHLRRYKLKLYPGKARIGATDANFPGHIISPVGVNPDGDKLLALTHMPDKGNVKQLRVYLVVSATAAFLNKLATRVRPFPSQARSQRKVHRCYGRHRQNFAAGTVSAPCFGVSGLGCCGGQQQ